MKITKIENGFNDQDLHMVNQLHIQNAAAVGISKTQKDMVRLTQEKNMKISLRTKLITSSLAVIIICGLVATLVAIRLIGTGIIGQAQDKVRIDLNSARHIYQDEIQEVKALLDLSSQRFFIKDALLKNDVETLKGRLEEITKR